MLKLLSGCTVSIQNEIKASHIHSRNITVATVPDAEEARLREAGTSSKLPARSTQDLRPMLCARQGQRPLPAAAGLRHLVASPKPAALGARCATRVASACPTFAHPAACQRSSDVILNRAAPTVQAPGAQHPLEQGHVKHDYIPCAGGWCMWCR